MKTHAVLKHPSDILRVTSQPVRDEDLSTPEFQALIDEMIATMAKENGVGIAGPQIGKHLRVIIAETEHGPEAFINPKIVSRSFKMIDSEEGCLSVPGVFGIVRRHKDVKVKAKNRHGEPITIQADKLLSVIFQHEIDHLDGILFIDRAERIVEGDNPNAI